MQYSLVALHRFFNSAFSGPQQPLGGGLTLKCPYMPVFPTYMIYEVVCPVKASRCNI